jgi:hypothetical protein
MVLLVVNALANEAPPNEETRCDFDKSLREPLKSSVVNDLHACGTHAHEDAHMHSQE